MNNKIKSNTIPPLTLLDSDLYFCKNCNQGWKDKKWMMCCKGCVGHKDMGWTLEEMQYVYSTAMDSLIAQNQDPRYFFPLIKREKCNGKCPRRLSFSPFRTYYNKDILQPFAHYQLDWRVQQAEFLKRFSAHPCKLTWDSIDPEVQRLVVYKESIRY